MKQLNDHIKISYSFSFGLCFVIFLKRNCQNIHPTKILAIWFMNKNKMVVVQIVE
jgi:hypothetical protein